MKVISTIDLVGTDRDVPCPKGGFFSIRAILEEDGMGFTMTRTYVPKGEKQFWHYKNHLEACFCIEGGGVLTDKETGDEYQIGPDTIYVLDKNDPHYFQAIHNTVLVCVFNPPLKGREVHGEDGSYPS